jgi:hypothetical protein
MNPAQPVTRNRLMAPHPRFRDLGERKRLTAALDSGELEAAMRKEAGLKADVDATRAAVEEEEARAKDRAAAVKQAHSEWTKEMTVLRDLF